MECFLARGAFAAPLPPWLSLWLWCVCSVSEPERGLKVSCQKNSVIYFPSRAVNNLSAAMALPVCGPGRLVCSGFAGLPVSHAGLGDNWAVGAFWPVGSLVTELCSHSTEDNRRQWWCAGWSARFWVGGGTGAGTCLYSCCGVRASVDAGSLLVGLLVFGVLFAVNSALQSYLIVSYADEAGVSLDVGFTTWPMPWGACWERYCPAGYSRYGGCQPVYGYPVPSSGFQPSWRCCYHGIREFPRRG